MRFSFFICTFNLVILGICGGIFAFSGFDLLSFLMLGNGVAIRSFLGICLVSSLFVVYYLAVFALRRR